MTGSLRAFSEELRAEGELVDVDVPVDPEWEVGAVCRENFDRRGPALRFTAVEGFETPLVAGLLDTRERYSRALGADPDLESITEAWQAAYDAPLEPREVTRSEAPVKGNTVRDVDLYEDPFPVPVWHELDGGPYLGTLHGVVSKDPETGWVNIGAYRNQVMDETRLGIGFASHRHIGIHYEKYRERGEDMPVAIVVGGPPTLTIASVTSMSTEESEYDIAGGLRGSGIEVTRGETVDLPVPARAEIVLEGRVPTDDTLDVPEGPFGEFHGYMGRARDERNYVEVDQVTHRDDPVFQGTYEGRPPSESTTLRQLGRSTDLYQHLEVAGIPGVENVCVTAEGCAKFEAVVSIDKQYVGHVRDVMLNVLGKPNMDTKHCVVVDDDIDPWDSDLVGWARNTRVQAARDVTIMDRGKTARIDPSSAAMDSETDLMGIDATKPVEEYANADAEFPPRSEPPAEWVERVRERWREYGLDGSAG